MTKGPGRFGVRANQFLRIFDCSADKILIFYNASPVISRSAFNQFVSKCEAAQEFEYLIGVEFLDIEFR